MTSSFDAQINYEPNNNCTDLTTEPSRLNYEHLPFRFAVKKLLLVQFRSQYGHWALYW